MRLDAACALATGKSRKECREGLRKGLVTVNGSVEKRADCTVSGSDSVLWDGEPLDLREHLYFMLNKPSGLVCTTEDTEESVLRLFPLRYRKRLFCVGRLDKDTTGLLLLTDDGEFDHKLMSPKHHAEKVYAVSLAHPLSNEDKKNLEGGILLKNGERTQPCQITVQTQTSCLIALCEGKYHQVKRMFAAVSNCVLSLKRLSVGGLVLDDVLKEGEWRELTCEEVEFLKTR